MNVILAFTDGDQWRPGIGDPSVMGWITVAMYALGCGTCIVAAKNSRATKPEQPKAVFWGVLAAILLILGINKQLDLQTWLTLTAKRVALAQGWYEGRRVLQLVFIALIGIMGLVGFYLMWRLVKTHWTDLWLPLAGFFLLLSFVLIRAASFHHVDAMLKWEVGGFKMNWVLELGAISLIIIGAVGRLRRSKPGVQAAAYRVQA
jgi:hypothetical protein